MDAEEDLDLVKRPEKFQTYGGYSKGMIFTLSLSFFHCNNLLVFTMVITVNFQMNFRKAFF